MSMESTATAMLIPFLHKPRCCEMRRISCISSTASPPPAESPARVEKHWVTMQQRATAYHWVGCAERELSPTKEPDSRWWTPTFPEQEAIRLDNKADLFSQRDVRAERVV